MNIIFTLCSNNYLAQARVLIQSVERHAPHYTIVLGLVDKLSPDIDYEFLRPAIVCPVDSIGIPNFEDCCRRYNIIELNTSVKASLFKYLIRTYPTLQNIFYFDPDTKLYSDLSPLEQLLATNEILLTPHVLRPIELDGLIPQENVFLNYGLFNLGFLGLNARAESVTSFLDWWEERCLRMCFVRLEEGLFVDQLWANLVPLFFHGVHVVEQYGCNMGPWNVHERKIVSQSGQMYYLNDGSRLLFYHFSGYRYGRPESLSSDPYNRVALAERKDLKDLYAAYQEELLANKVRYFSKLRCELLALPEAGHSE